MIAIVHPRRREVVDRVDRDEQPRAQSRRRRLVHQARVTGVEPGSLDDQHLTRVRPVRFTTGVRRVRLGRRPALQAELRPVEALLRQPLSVRPGIRAQQAHQIVVLVEHRTHRARILLHPNTDLLTTSGRRQQLTEHGSVLGQEPAFRSVRQPGLRQARLDHRRHIGGAGADPYVEPRAGQQPAYEANDGGTSRVQCHTAAPSVSTVRAKSRGAGALNDPSMPASLE
ncbi:MAG TPA: hypothetical protein VNQ73_02345 [Ilumatobacter sp.]|nr:hypothetical protein [Ilumatobacter sp.]